MISETIKTAVETLQNSDTDRSWVPWTDIPIAGQLLFCQVCKQIRRSSCVVADITTLNFNLMFEIGFSIALGVPTVMIRDTSYAVDKEHFKQLGLFDTLGYVEFSNSDQLKERLQKVLPEVRPLGPVPQRAFRESPIYVVKSVIPTEGSMNLESTLKKSRLRYRTYDPEESVRITLNDARRQVTGSIAVVANLLDPNRDGARVHNALVAFIAGFSTGSNKVVKLLQEGDELEHSIDFRDLISTYSVPSKIRGLLKPTLDQVYELLQSRTFDSNEVRELGILHRLDLGDVAAENEIGGLLQYFVPTGQSISASRGNARLVVGRKGTGKSAIFYDIRNSEGSGVDDLVLDLRPEGHQFTRLKEFVNERLSGGMQEFVVSGFWDYLLWTEIARRALSADESIARRDSNRYEQYRDLEKVYSNHDPGEFVDFPQRLAHYISRLVNLDETTSGDQVMQGIYQGEAKKLRNAVAEYLENKNTVWLLIDNLDKGWPVGGSTALDILVIQALLDATRKVQNELGRRGVQFSSLLFLRSDIYDHLIRQIPDKGKDTVIKLEWNDPKFFERLIERRILTSTDLHGDFRTDIWPSICEPLVETQDSFTYMLDRTLMRPRDLILFLSRCLQTAINRGHDRIQEEDIKFAEQSYSADQLANLEFEILDLNPGYEQVLYAFSGAPSKLTLEDCRLQLEVYADISDEAKAEKTIDVLLRYGFFGVVGGTFQEPTYIFSSKGTLDRLRYPLDNDEGSLVVHPAFRPALQIENQSEN